MLSLTLGCILLFFFFLGFVLNLILNRIINRYSNYPCYKGISGDEIGKKVLNSYNRTDIQLVSEVTRLKNHYRYSEKTINLDGDIYYGYTILSNSVATYKAIHAIKSQRIHSIIEVIQSISNKIFTIILVVSIIGGIIDTLSVQEVLIIIGIFYASTVLISLITISRNNAIAKESIKWMQESKIIVYQEYYPIKDALKWCSKRHFIVSLGSLSMLFTYFFCNL